MIIETLIVGGGPAGIAPLLSASRSGLLDRLLADGVAIVERGHVLGSGCIGRYAIHSDSTGNTLASCVFGNQHPAFAALRDHPAAKAVAGYGNRSVPLSLVSALMTLVGSALRDLMAASGNPVLFGHEAIDATRTRDGLWRTRLRRCSDGAEISVCSRFLILATGGHQPISRIASRIVGGRGLLPSCATKLVQSDEALTAGGLATIGSRLAAGRNKRIAIVGSSSSALACANAVLKAPFGCDLEPGAIALLHRRPLRLFYPSVSAALADGYNEFGNDDLCPITGFVFRFSGLRFEARELVMAARGIGGRPPERRLRLHQVGTEHDPLAIHLLDQADIVISALGYCARGLPLATATGKRLDLFADESGARPLVDSLCRVLDRNGTAIEGLFGIGLGTGFFSREIVGGEPSFSGQTNSLWQWQNAVGGLIVRQIQGGAALTPLAPTRTVGMPAPSAPRWSSPSAVIADRDRD